MCSIVLILFLAIPIIQSEDLLSQWPNHDISTLKLLQVVHRHGDRTVEILFPNDPFLNETQYWPEGTGELTLEGKYRMYIVGQYLRQHYAAYLGSDYSPREVYARSSAQSRCLESVSLVISGAYPTSRSRKWQWNQGVSRPLLGQIWQPFPIYTYPAELIDNDRLLRPSAYCPKAAEAERNFSTSEGVVSTIDREKEFLQYLSSKVGAPLNILEMIYVLRDSLWIEYNRGYKWSDFGRWPPSEDREIIDRLLPIGMELWNNKYTDRTIKRLRAGPLVGELADNMRFKLNGTSRTKYNHKLYVYSTHDTNVATLLHALSLWNGQLVPFGASVLLELHQRAGRDTGARGGGSDGYFVRIYYFNETLDATKWPYLLAQPNCGGRTDCPIDQFFEFTNEIVPDDWDRECGITDLSHDSRQ